MKTMFQSILKASWKIVIHQPVLWIFGLFAAILIGNGGELDRFLRYSDAMQQQTGIINLMFWSQQNWYQVAEQVIANQQVTLLTIPLIVLAWFIVLYVVSVSQGTLFSATKPANFVTLFHNGHRHGWTLFVLNISVYLLISSALLSNLLLPTWLCLSVIFPVILLLSFITRYATGYIVLKNEHLGTAVIHAVTLIYRNFFKTVIMSCLTFGLALVINIGIVLAIGIIILPLYSFVFTDTSQLYTINLISIITYTVIVVLVGSIVSAWQWVAWSLLFKELTD
ncbi:MAG: hypothetical protein WCW27_05180 [Patescibacteria group bacterium]